MLEYEVISPNRLHLPLEDAKSYFLKDQDPFLSLVRPPGDGAKDFDEEFLTLKKSYQSQKRLGAITFTRPKKAHLFPMATKRPLPVLVISADLGTLASKYSLPNFIKIPQKLNDPDIVKWLKSDFELDKESSVPRGLMYEAYKQFCRVNLHCITNQACFGKSVRGVFPNLQTRRIGIRGHSKYHYFGLRPKPGTTTAEFFKRRQEGARKSIRSVNRRTTEKLNEKPKSDLTPAPKDEPGRGHLRAIISILIPEFPTSRSLDVSDVILKEAKTLLHCAETYAVEVLRATLNSVINTDFQEVFAATSKYWRTVRHLIKDEDALCHPEILELMSVCDRKIQAAIRDILLPDLFKTVSDEKQAALGEVFSGTYLKEMMAAVTPAPETVRQLKKCVYRKFTTEMLDQLHFTRLLKKVEGSLENLPASRSLQRALMKLDVDHVVSKCRLAFAMKKASFISTEKQLRQGLSAFHASLNNCFHLRHFLDWIKSCVTNQIETDCQQTSHPDLVVLTLLCFSYAVSLVFSELEKHMPPQLRSGLRNLQLLLTDYICCSVRGKCKHTKHDVKH